MEAFQFQELETIESYNGIPDVIHIRMWFLLSLDNPLSAYTLALACPCMLGQCFVRAWLARCPLPGHFPPVLRMEEATIKE